MNKHKYVIIFLFLIILLCISGTIAFKTTNETANNIITFGNIKVKLIQTTIDNNGEEVEINNDNEFNITTDSSVDRFIKACNVGKQDIYLRISLNTKGFDKNDQEFDANNLVDYVTNNQGWIYKNEYYYYHKALKPNECTETLLKKINFNIDKISSNYPDSSYKFKADLQAVQSKNNAEDVLQAEGWPDKE